MAQMPAPIVDAPTANRAQLSLPRLATNKAMAEAATAATQDTIVVTGAKPIATGSVKASMPTKCMHQMPVPRASEPTAHQACAMRRARACTRCARSSAT